jgi:SPP1 gp7 family putative phage head morphogenesis protein
MTNEIVKSPWFKNFAQFAVEHMITMSRNDTARSWREAARQSSQGRKIYEALKRETDQDKIYQKLLARNMYYITSAPLDMAERMAKLVAEEQLKGKRPEWISEQLKALFPDMTKAKATLIARTESSKASSELVQARAQKLGYNWYTWKTSSDQRVRGSHRHMSDVICNYSNPPSPEKLDGEKSYGEYGPGEIFNCRCYASVMFDVDEISWPHKVYYSGSIRMMTKKQFREIL